jgi:hypothetical protein
VIERARKGLPDVLVEYFVVKDATYDIRDQYSQAQADLGEIFEPEVMGFVEHGLPSVANLRADQSLSDMLVALAHESRHIWQATSSIGQTVHADRREEDALWYAKQALPRLLEEIRRR